jgi:hypothetical protein
MNEESYQLVTNGLVLAETEQLFHFSKVEKAKTKSGKHFLKVTLLSRAFYHK